ncbi:hypothetical protein AB0F25_13670 [Streptomyces wedmorensis]|uniref:hypothetical protein n=1 Tax=Streptomyces wedmorensis TaxID=43759 RepID=UPI0034424856
MKFFSQASSAADFRKRIKALIPEPELLGKGPSTVFCAVLESDRVDHLSMITH